jgi:uncharacterized protein
MHLRPPVTLPGTATHTLGAATLEETLQIDVSMPIRYDEDSDLYPVVYLIDSRWYFPIVSQAVRLIGMDGEMPRVIVVGIGYEPEGLSVDREEQRFTRLRCRDLTPTVDTNDEWRVAVGHPKGVPGDTGRAENFVQIIERDVKPFIERQYRVDPEDQTLAGFSFGALFALHVLFQHPGLFRRYVVGSPSLWWDGGLVFQYEEKFAANNLDLKKALFLSIGALEESGPWQSFNMVKNLRLLTERLVSRNYPSLRLESLILENETHSTGAAWSFIKGLLSVFRQSA